jgi:hypothetical protein
MVGYVFMHIPKTAGTSLRTALVHAIGQCPPAFAATRVSQEDSEQWREYPLICGHISRDDQLRWFPERRLITALREPIDRCLSTIYYFKTYPADAGPLFAAAHELPEEDFVNHPLAMTNTYNRMVRQLGGHVLDDPSDLPAMLERAKETIAHAWWVSLHDTIAEDVHRTFNIALPTENVTPRRPSRLNAPQTLIDRLAALNHFDLLLWEWATERITARKNQTIG